MLFIDEVTNLKRQREFDLAKAFSIFAMVIIHVYEELSVVEYGAEATGWFDNLLEFLAGPFAAPMFMLTMGVGIVYSSHRNPGELAMRGLKLFGLSYLLGLLRFGISYAAFSAAYQCFDFETFFMSVCNVDILQFAGLSFMLTALLKKWKVSVPAMAVIAVAMQIVGQLLAQLSIKSVYAQCLLGLFFYTSDNACFPLLLWYIFPVVGILFAKYLRHVSNVDMFYRNLLVLSSTALIGLGAALYFTGFDLRRFYLLYEDTFYRQDFLSAAVCVLLVILELSLFHYLLKVIRVPVLEKAITFLSTNLNRIYIAQWIIIGNAAILFMFTGSDYLERVWIVPAGIAIVAVSAGLTALWVQIRKRKGKAA